MAQYRCFIRGEYFPGHAPREPRAWGFYTTRWIEAATENEAEQTVLALLRGDPDLQLPVGAPKPTATKIYFEAIEAVARKHKVGSGFTWFQMDDDEAKVAARQLELDVHHRGPKTR